MKKGIRLNKKFVAGLTMALAVAGCTGGMAIKNKTNAEAASGTERWFSVNLAHQHGNYYFPFRTKETNENKGTVRVDAMNTSGVSVWFNEGTSLQNLWKVSDVVTIKTKGKKRNINYSGKCNAGMSVDLGIENAESTLIKQDQASGYVNYK